MSDLEIKAHREASDKFYLSQFDLVCKTNDQRNKLIEIGSLIADYAIAIDEFEKLPPEDRDSKATELQKHIKECEQAFEDYTQEFLKN